MGETWCYRSGKIRVESEVTVAVMIHIVLIRAMTPCSLIGSSQSVEWSRRTTSTVTISWHYLTRSTSLKYLYLKKENFKSTYFGLSHTSVSSDHQLQNAGLRSSLSLFIH
jgi:hypothetical protein